MKLTEKLIDEMFESEFFALYSEEEINETRKLLNEVN